MNRLVSALALFACCPFVQAAPPTAVPDSIRIEDADTLLVEVGGTGYRIQLPDVDAPENTANPKLQHDVARTGLDAETLLALGRRADEGLQALLDSGSSFALRFDPQVRDKYGRTPGDLVAPDGKTLSLLLVERGYAIPLRAQDTARAAALEAALTEARSAGRGLWGSDAEAFATWSQPAAPVSR